MRFLARALLLVFLTWMPLGIAIVGLSLVTYAAVQQSYRESLNDPQIQMAEDAAAQLSAGAPIDSVIATGTTDIATSLAPWIAAYDASGAPIRSSGALSQSSPLVPAGVLSAAKANTGKDTSRPHEDRVTWQPTAGVRQAIVAEYVVTPTGVEYVVAGRSMREVEEREQGAEKMVSYAMLALLILTFLFAAIAGPLRLLVKRWR